MNNSSDHFLICMEKGQKFATSTEIRYNYGEKGGIYGKKSVFGS